MSTSSTGVCRVPDCGRALGVEPWEHDGYCWVHTDALFRFIDEVSARAEKMGVSPGELLAREWIGAFPRPQDIRDVLAKEARG